MRPFLVPSGVALDNQGIIDIAHETIIRHWPLLLTWIAEEPSSAEFYRRLAAVAVEYKEGLAGIYREPQLTRALAWLEQAHPTAAWAKQYQRNSTLLCVFSMKAVRVGSTS